MSPRCVLPCGEAVAVIPVRDGVPPLGADEAIAEAAGRAVLAGSGVRDAARALASLRVGWCAEIGDFAPARWAARLAAVVGDISRVILPASADGRDLAPRLASKLGRPLLAGAVRVSARGAELLRWNGHVAVGVAADPPFVATLQPGCRGSRPLAEPANVVDVDLPDPAAGPDPAVLRVLPADPATVDLAEAPRILGAGAGLARGALAGQEAVVLLGKLAAALGASLGATRVVTDAGWADYQRQIGTTGVVVDPELYVAFGISGAVQHLGGLGTPHHVVSINTDPSCPMTAMADLGIVADAASVLNELVQRLVRDESKVAGSG